jgi:hypothetical protein
VSSIDTEAEPEGAGMLEDVDDGLGVVVVDVLTIDVVVDVLDVDVLDVDVLDVDVLDVDVVDVDVLDVDVLDVDVVDVVGGVSEPAGRIRNASASTISSASERACVKREAETSKVDNS